MPRYRGESNAYDIANNKIYRGDLLFAWDVGDTLTGWTLSGGTLPTIALDGRINLYEASAGANSIDVYYDIPNTMGQFYGIANMKFIIMGDDTSTNAFAFAGQLSAYSVVTGGLCVNFNNVVSLADIRWINSSYTGSMVSGISAVINRGTEYTLSLIISPDKTIALLNNVKLGEIPISNKGTCPMNATQLKDHFAQTKKIHLYAGHAAGQISHVRVRDIRVSRLVGISSM